MTTRPQLGSNFPLNVIEVAKSAENPLLGKLDKTLESVR